MIYGHHPERTVTWWHNERHQTHVSNALLATAPLGNNLRQVSRTPLRMSPSSIICYWWKQGGKQTNHVTHWPRVCSLQASAGVWNVISVLPHGPRGLGRIFTLNLLRMYY